VASVVIPDPSLVVLVGAAGSGKSTLAARLFALDEIVSSDTLRGVVSGDEADQAASAVAFRILYRTVQRRLADGRLTVVDATSTTPHARRPLIALARAAAVPLVAIVLDLPGDVVRAQNAGRARTVDDDVIDRHLDAVRRTVDGAQLAAEGFDTVAVLHSQLEATSLTVTRRPRR
jgi:protein phosphatase